MFVTKRRRDEISMMSLDELDREYAHAMRMMHIWGAVAVVGLIASITLMVLAVLAH